MPCHAMLCYVMLCIYILYTYSHMFVVQFTLLMLYRQLLLMTADDSNVSACGRTTFYRYSQDSVNSAYYGNGRLDTSQFVHGRAKQH